jgi:hypothetical protein
MGKDRDALPLTGKSEAAMEGLLVCSKIAVIWYLLRTLGAGGLELPSSDELSFTHNFLTLEQIATEL